MIEQMIEQKNIARRWFACLFGHVTGSAREPEKISSAEIFSLALTRSEAEILTRPTLYTSAVGFHAQDLFSLCDKLTALTEALKNVPARGTPPIPPTPPPADLGKL